MILHVSDRIWKEYVKAVEAFDKFQESDRPFSHFKMSMDHIDVIERVRVAKIKLLSSLHAPQTSDRAELQSSLDATRARSRRSTP